MKYHEISDMDLWQYCKQDDLKAYKELFRRFSPKLYKQAVVYIKDGMIAEELVLDLLFSIWQKRHEPIMQGEIAPYLFRCMRNAVLKYLRKNIPPTLSFQNLSEDSFVEEKRADYNLIVAENQKIYESSLSDLSPQRREVFRLSREENLSYAEIAIEMNLSVNTVENYMVAALKSLRKKNII
jgi:RNA polymerase sigma-70 factor (family 1)